MIFGLLCESFNAVALILLRARIHSLKEYSKCNQHWLNTRLAVLLKSSNVIQFFCPWGKIFSLAEDSELEMGWVRDKLEPQDLGSRWYEILLGLLSSCLVSLSVWDLIGLYLTVAVQSGNLLFHDYPLDAFSWEEYLKETSSVPAPPNCFRQVCPPVSLKCLIC